MPISSFSVQNQNGAVKYIQATIPGIEYAEQIAERASGYIIIAKEEDGEEFTIATLAITAIRIDEGSNNQSITLQANA